MGNVTAATITDTQIRTVRVTTKDAGVHHASLRATKARFDDPGMPAIDYAEWQENREIVAAAWNSEHAEEVSHG